jgi:hypothetical protein
MRHQQQIKLTRITPEYWRVTFHNPPYNIYGPETMPQLNEVVTAIESDPKLVVVVFDSDVPDFFLTHYDFVPPLTDTTSLPNGPTGLPPLPDMLVRLSKAPVVANWPWPATCALPAARKPSSRNGKSAPHSCPVVAPWPDCQGSWGVVGHWRCC